MPAVTAKNKAKQTTKPSAPAPAKHAAPAPPPPPPPPVAAVPPAPAPETLPAKIPPPATGASAAVSKIPNIEELIGEDVGSGLEGMSKDDFAIPRLVVLQALSPQCNPRDGAYVEGAQAGMIYDNVSGKLYDGQDGISMILVSYRRAHLEWIPRAKGGGFVMDHGADPSILSKCKVGEKNERTLANGNEIVITAEYFAFLLEEEATEEAERRLFYTGNYDRVLVPMFKTSLISAKKLNTVAQSLQVTVKGRQHTAPLFYRTYRLTTAPRSNEHGSWFVWDFKPGPDTLTIATGEGLPFGEKAYLEARSFRESIAKGEVRVAEPEAGAGAADHSGDAGGDDAPM